MMPPLKRQAGALSFLLAGLAALGATRAGLRQQESALPVGCWAFHVASLSRGPLAGFLARGWAELQPGAPAAETAMPRFRGREPHALRLWDPEVVGLWPDYAAWYSLGDSIAIMLSLDGEAAHFQALVQDSVLSGAVRLARSSEPGGSADSAGPWHPMSAVRRSCRGS